jgi:hypothetical protein
VGTKCTENAGVSLLLLLLLQVAHNPALPASGTMRTTGEGNVIVDTILSANDDDDDDA